MEVVYEKIADAINDIIPKLHSTVSIVPIGIDGAITYHLLDYSMTKKMLSHFDCLQNTVQLSSNKNLMDLDRLYETLLRECDKKRKHIYCLDMRAKTGKLADLLHMHVNDFKSDVNTMTIDYAVLFDPKKRADIRASEEELTDDEKSILKWFDRPQDAPIMQVNGHCDYSNLSHDNIAMLRHVPEIKSLL
jgi:hypothetical protein